MKIKSLFAIVLALTLLTCTFVLPTSAKETTNDVNVEIIIMDEVSAETEERIREYFATGEPAEDDGVATCGLTCTLFGHKTEISSVSTITHKVRSTSPRCLKKTYKYEECTRCDYAKSTLTSSEYIVCC